MTAQEDFYDGRQEQARDGSIVASPRHSAGGGWGRRSTGSSAAMSPQLDDGVLRVSAYQAAASGPDPEPMLALAPLLGLAGGVALPLAIFAGGYGYHRDELCFLAAGVHLAWGYADQGLLTG